MKILLHILIICILSPPHFCFSEENPAIQKQQIQSNKLLALELQKKLSIVEKTIEKQKELISKNASIKKKTDNNEALIKRMDSKLDQTKKEQNLIIENASVNKKNINAVKNELEDTRQMIEESLKMNRIGSILILLSLLFEIPGAIFLGGANLAHDQPHVFSLYPTPDTVKAWSFGLEKVWDRLSFYGLFASFFLIIGFLMQVVGITFILSLSLWSSVCFIIIAIGICFSIVYFLLGQHPNQSRNEKIKIFYLNIRRLFPFYNSVRCDYCSKRVSKSNCHVWWIKAPDPETRPYSTDLKKMHIGHKECLEKSGWYKYIGNNEKLYEVSPLDFMETYLQNLEEWWAAKRANSTSEKGKIRGGTQYDHEYITVVDKISKLVRA
ncbi:MAG: hypothetical protein U9N34_08970 [Candidatus Cloacimonadota bacterium]|nr:hypothetical protein [Candidatus Cloacimonadota bacterium]